MKNVSLQVTCHQCDRTGTAVGISHVLSQSSPPLPQFILVGHEDGFSAMLAWCTLCPLLPPAVTQIRASGDPIPFTEMPELLFLPLKTSARALELTKMHGATPLGKNYFLEIIQQLNNKG